MTPKELKLTSVTLYLFCSSSLCRGKSLRLRLYVLFAGGEEDNLCI